ncbi:L,D-transpeptidase family protein [Rhizobium sp. NTR19]|uniref:L,D-transpeptidase family protein n=1 Tax=Neorhizobium turbinariae TaxID=2937795 RepID=A0ABT0ILB8_9HYPH|nr:L,D-transpeptidase family protein [Neorhizobium turbinariae]MCK8778667.1 L,D-transpeptidase family protein [Neorhizobium turbinariae]
MASHLFQAASVRCGPETGKTLQHSSRKISLALALVSSVSVYAGAVAPANAITLMDILRGGPGKNRQVEPQQVVPGVATGRAAMPSEKALADPEPLPKVTGPRYYTYKADAQRAVKTAGFAAASAADGTQLIAEAKVTAPADIAAALEGYYAKNAEPLWVADGDINEKARGVLALFDRAEEFGLDPADYRLTVPALVTASVAAPLDAAAEVVNVATDESVATDAGATDPVEGHQRALMQFELALSGKVLMFAQDMLRGRIDANRISGYHDIKRKDMKLAVVLPFAKTSTDAAAYLEGLEPKSAHYQALKAELAKLRAEDNAAGPQIELPTQILLKPGKSSADLGNIIAAIQQKSSEALKTKHADVLASYQQTPDYTPELVDVVKSFQTEAGLKPDGVVGAATIRKLTGHTAEDKIKKIVVAMEQARWLPDELGNRYVFINQPAFRVYYHDNGVEQFSMRTVVGSKANQTYFFQDEIETVEFNPYWGVPQSIIINEMLPRLRQDPSYLDRLGYEVSVGGKTVSSTSVNWYGSTDKISVRQPPSSDNALGDLKILFPNSHAIYMHDTPSKSFFQRDMRALSHGCVRLAEPRKMAAAVLGTTIEDVNARIAGGQNVAVKAPVKIPVYISYFTAWPNKDGVVEFFDDVYGRDDAVAKAFDATTKARATKV